MKKHILSLSIVFFILSFHFLYPVEIKFFKQWKHNVDIGGEISHCLLDKEDNIIIVHRPGISLVNERQFLTFSEWGQGPNQINSVYAICDYRGDLAVFELKNQIKIFKKEGETYTEVNKKWLKTDPRTYLLRDAFYTAERFFLGGLITIKKEKGKLYGALVMAYNDITGQTEKNFVFVQYPDPSDHYLIRKHFEICGDYLLFLPQNEMKLYLISLDTLILEKTVELKTPKFYVSMPKSFFLFKKYQNDSEYWENIVTWMTSYSAVTRIVVLKNRYLILQVRTCNPTKKRFALLFYDINNSFSLENIQYVDDLLLAGRKDLLYFVHGGDPMIDEEANRMIIDVYQLNQ